MAEVTTAEVMQKLALSLKSIKEELQQWHEESKRNQASIATLNKRLDMLSQKTTPSPSVQNELNQIKSKLESLSLQPVVGGTPEAKQLLEQKLTEINQELDQIKALQTKMQELASTSETGDRRIEEQIRALKTQVEATPRETPSTQKESQEFLTALQKDLEDWHKESMQNSKELTNLIKKIGSIESKTVADEKIKKDIEKTMAQMTQITDSINKFEELKQTIVDHNKEFEELYSTIGKERVELDSLNESVTKLQTKLTEWSERNKENLEEVTDIRRDLVAVTKELKGKKIDELATRMQELADRVESLQRQEQQLQDMQEKLLEFDQGLKELVRKSVVASLSRKEFEEELGKLESATKRPRLKAKPPAKKDVKAKMRQLRAALEEEKEDSALMDTFTHFEKEINSADTDEQKNLLWNSLQKDIEHAVKDSVDKAKKKIGETKAAGGDTSKLNILVAKTDIGLVSLETSASLRNLVKTKEIVQKLSDLKSQIEKAL